MKISVLIPIFNTPAHHILEAVKSVLDQTYKADEIVIVDDGSTLCKTIEAISFCEKRYGCKVFSLEKHEGISAALNFGIDKCQNEWIARMDADDICFPNRFAKQVEHILANPETVVLGTGLFGFLDGDPLRKEFFRISKDEKYFNPELKDDWLYCTNHPTVMYRKSIISKFKYNHKGKGQDVHLWAELLKAGHTINNIPDILLAYRKYS
jgi:glycosyltransferase involved in cell wall biosynthesis